MTSTITCPDLRLLASGEFAGLDSSFGWRFLEQDAEDSSSHEVAGTPARLAMLSAAQSSLPLHQMPDSFKAGFVRAFYSTPSANRSRYHNPSNPKTGEPFRNELDLLLLLMGLKVGRQASRKTGRRFAPEAATSPAPGYWCTDSSSLVAPGP